jgi:hypothetical protein
VLHYLIPVDNRPLRARAAAFCDDFHISVVLLLLFSKMVNRLRNQ